MLDCTNNLRQCYLNILQNNVIYNGKVIPIYGETPFETTPSIYVVLSSVNENADNNNQLFISNSDIDIDIFVEQYRKPDLSVVDSISSLILNLLIPSTGIHDVGDAYFQIYPLSRISSRYLNGNDGDVYLSRKIITINNSIIQK